MSLSMYERTHISHLIDCHYRCKNIHILVVLSIVIIKVWTYSPQSSYRLSLSMYEHTHPGRLIDCHYRCTNVLTLVVLSIVIIDVQTYSPWSSDRLSLSMYERTHPGRLIGCHYWWTNILTLVVFIDVLVREEELHDLLEVLVRHLDLQGHQVHLEMLLHRYPAHWGNGK